MSNIKLFVVCHKDFNTLNNNTFVPIQVGTKINGNRLDGILHDDDKEPNISHKNKMYCEMTAHYYAFKHVDADYYGFLHYRRYFSFKDEHFKTNFENLIIENCLNEEVVKKYGLDEKSVAEMVEKYDLLIPKKRPSIGSVKASYCAAKTQSKDDYNFCCEYIKKNYPEMIKAMNKYNRSWAGYYCNMFVMKKQIFMNYAKWLFEILEAHEKHFDMEHYDVQSYRVSGYLAERLTGMYLQYLIDNTDLKIKKLQVIKFLNCDKPKPYDDAICNVVIECNSKDYNQTNVLVNSIVQNSSTEHKYNILILERHLKDYQKNQLKQYKTKNVNVEIAKNCKKTTLNYKKYIKLCPNSLVLSDIYELYEKQTSSRYTGANNIFDIIKFGKTRLDKQAKMLKKDDVYKHFDKSVMLVNTEQPNNSPEILGLEWNLPVDQKLNINEKLYSFGSHKIFNQYVVAKKAPKIVTYHGKIIPLMNDMSEMANFFWEYAKTSNMFITLLRYNMYHYKNIRKSFYDTIAPVGTPLRDLIRTYFKKY